MRNETASLDFLRVFYAKPSQRGHPRVLGGGATVLLTLLMGASASGQTVKDIYSHAR